MMTKIDHIAETAHDARLVFESLRGDREAFGEIVARYQTLVCSLAYSATGSLTKSEDLAQETFLTAWKQLSTLRDPGKLRPWLCRIARNLICDGLRKQKRDPSHEAEPLEAGSQTAAIDSEPGDELIDREEQAILWRSVERIPEIYREPLILFYREHHSVASVAAALELSEDAVKQRLSRGRKLLHEQVLSFVEGALERTAPGRGFTLGVIAALPVFATSAAAATVGSAAAHGSATAKGATLVGLFNALIGPAIGLLGAYIGMKASLNSARTPVRDSAG